jgi:hypothetical protein
MKIKKVIKPNNLPTKLPVAGSALWFTVLHYWHAPEWLWGVFGLALAIIWRTAIWARHNEQSVTGDSIIN